MDTETSFLKKANLAPLAFVGRGHGSTAPADPMLQASLVVDLNLKFPLSHLLSESSMINECM